MTEETMTEEPSDFLPVVLKWDRVGSYHAVADLDISSAVDLVELEELIATAVQPYFAPGAVIGIEAKVQIELNGGPFYQLPFGKGRIELDFGCRG